MCNSKLCNYKFVIHFDVLKQKGDKKSGCLISAEVINVRKSVLSAETV